MLACIVAGSGELSVLASHEDLDEHEQKKPDKYRVCLDLETVGKKLNAPKIVLEDALSICRNMIGGGHTSVRNSHTGVLASFYASCRKNGFPVTLKELSHIDESGKVDWRVIAHFYKRIVEEMGLEISVASPMQYLQQIATKAGLSHAVTDLSVGIIAKTRTEPDGAILGGKDPRAIAAGALYIAGLAVGEKAKEKDLADSAGITESAVRHSIRALRTMRFARFMLASAGVK